MATTKQAFEDFPKIMGTIQGIKVNIEDVIREIEGLELLETEILNNPERKAEIKKLIDLHPTITLTKINNELIKLKDIKIYFEEVL